MKHKAREILICDCGGTMPIDGKALANACGGTGDEVATSLCRSQTDRILRALEGDAPVAIACTQETAVFEALAEEAGKPAPDVFNIRERAGWSDEAAKATPKMAALIAEAMHGTPGPASMALISHGRCLIYGRGEEALELGRMLKDDLGVTVMLTDPENTAPDAAMAGMVVTGRITSAKGYFTHFSITIDDFAEALPNSRDAWKFESPSDGVETGCDIVIDLTGGTPLFTGAHKRDGYLRADPDDIASHAALAVKAKSLIGEFEKPLYVRTDADLCAHSRNGITGCSRCLDVCPAGAISTAGNHVSIDPGICGGCGMCGAACPSGAVQTMTPPAEQTAGRMATLIDAYEAAGGKTPSLLLHDEIYGEEMISLLARHGRGLPARVIPLGLHSVARTGHDTIIAAVALGFEQVFVLLDPNKSDENQPVHDQVELALTLLAGAGIETEGRITIIDDADPDKVAEHLYGTALPKKFKPAPFAPAGTPRGMTRLAMRGLAKANKAPSEIIPLPAGAPYGQVSVDTDNCTICLSCVGACPAGALQDNPDAPQLLFREDACLQCGICAATCPEKVITLVPQFNLGDAAMTNQLIIEDEPFACTSCGKFFGTKRSIEAIVAKLEGHSMFTGEDKLNMLKQCEDCRVKSLFGGEEKMADVGERPRPRTTDDYLN
ncbi:4Fe-4S dicluster domain-containing protein [Alphaproteobacteria bacterium LSUCC0684]